MAYICTFLLCQLFASYRTHMEFSASFYRWGPFVCIFEERADLSHILSKNISWSAYWGLITKTRLYNYDPLKLHFYTVKLGFTGVYIIFLIYAKT